MRVIVRYKIHRKVLKTNIKNYIPSRYMNAFPSSWPDLITLILFRMSRDDVILSNTVKEALNNEKIKSEETIVAFGGCFTIESIQLLKDKGIHYVAINDFPWTDERYKQIRNE